MRILLVEDEPTVAEPLNALLNREGYAVTWAPNLEAAWRALADGEPDLAILDVMLPEGENAGFTLAKRLREAGYRGPILFLTARDALEDRVAGLDLGGDDYLVKPFAFQELVARVRALLRREAQTKQARLVRGPLEVDLAARRVRYDGRPVVLTEKEFALLERFALYPEKTFTVEELLERCFPGATSGPRIVRVYVHHLRQKLAPQVIETVPGGYRLGV